MAHGQAANYLTHGTKDGVNVKDSGQRQEFNSGAVRDTQEGKGRFDLLPFRALRLVARQFEEGAKKYGDRNWEKGIPVSRYFDSAMRHMTSFAEGQTDERHDVAAAWNILCMLDTIERAKEGKLFIDLLDMGRSLEPDTPPYQPMPYPCTHRCFSEGRCDGSCKR